MKYTAIILSTLISGCVTFSGSTTSELCGALCTAIESVETITAATDTTGLGEAQAELRSALAIAASSSTD